MNNKLQGLITLFNERKNFFNNHPDAYCLLKDTFAEYLPEGTEIEVTIKKPQGEKSSAIIKISEIDKKFVDSVSDILNTK